MNTQTISNEINKLAEKAEALVTATANIAGDEIGDARTRLAAALTRGKEIYSRVQEKENECSGALKKTINGHVFETIALALGLGALIGYASSRRCSAKCE